MTNIYEKLWKKLLKEVIVQGSYSTKDDADLVEKIGNHVFIPNPYLSSYAGLVDRNTFADAVKMGWFDIPDYPLKGEALYDYVVSLDDDSKIYLDDENSFIYTYPCRLLNYENKVNQFDIMMSRLMNNKGSNRAIATTLIPSWDGDREDIPCLQSLQVLIRDDELTLSCYFRSNDLYGAWPSNMMFLTYIGLTFVDMLADSYPNLIFKGIDYHSSSLHVYKTDLEAAKRVIQ